MYKLSCYNYFIPYEERMIYFNGISNQIFSLNLEEHDKMQVLLKDLISFEVYYKSIFDHFVRSGFIIDQSENEVDLLRYQNHLGIYSDRNYQIFINPTLECNFACWYCYEEHPRGFMNEETIGRLKKHFSYMIEDQHVDSIKLGWFGGEPLLYFDEVVYPVSQYAKKICEKNYIPYHAGITTNASKINEDMVKKMNEIGLNTFQITIDGDRTRHDKIRNDHGQPSFDLIMRNINLLCENIEDVYIILRLNYDDQTLRQCDMLSVFNEISVPNRKLIAVDFQRVWQTSRPEQGRNDERIGLYEDCCKMGFQQRGISNAFAVGKNHRCYADRLCYGEINYDGKVYRCTARGYDDRYVMGELAENGAIRWNQKKMAHHLGKSTFENEMCLACKYLPLCLGPCSQKMAEVTPETLKNVCSLNGCETPPEEVIIEYYKQKMQLVKNG